MQRVVHIFETSYAAVDRDLPKLLARHKPDIVLMFGLAGRTPQVRIETRARNAKSILFPDVTGLPAGRNARSLPGAPPGARPRPVRRACSPPRASSRVPTRLSRDAGRYLCNYVYWRALEARPDPARRSRSSSTSRRSRAVRAAAREARRRISHAALARAGEAILLALLAAQRRLG